MAPGVCHLATVSPPPPSATLQQGTFLNIDLNSLIVKHRDAFAPPEFEHDTSLRPRGQEVAADPQSKG